MITRGQYFVPHASVNALVWLVGRWVFKTFNCKLYVHVNPCTQTPISLFGDIRSRLGRRGTPRIKWIHTFFFCDNRGTCPFHKILEAVRQYTMWNKRHWWHFMLVFMIFMFKVCVCDICVALSFNIGWFVVLIIAGDRHALKMMHMASKSFC